MIKRIDLIAEARPNFMKIAPTIDSLKEAGKEEGSLRFRPVYTGQHYDRAIFETFREKLSIPCLPCATTPIARK